MSIDAVKKYNMFHPGDRVLCAVSGGADSMCMLHFLFSNRDELQIEVMAAHYEHGLRGDESLRDARFVREWCAEHGIVCRVEHGDVVGYAEKNRLGTEEAARELRYAFLRDCAGMLRCNLIATAHNLEDNAETMIFNLTRGGGSAGLRGIPPVRDNIVRPLILTSRLEIEEYLRKHGVSYVQDSSNFTDQYSRNIIRHKIMPVLKELNPGFGAAAARTAEIMRQDEDCLSSMAKDFIGLYLDDNSIPQREFKTLHRAVASRVIRQLCPESLGSGHVDTVLALAEGNGLAYTDIPGMRIRREQGRIYFGTGEKTTIKERVILPGETVNIPEAGINIEAILTEYGKEINGLFKTCCLKYESIYGRLICTGRKPGDKIRPLGRNCTKSLKSLFVEAGLTQHERDTVPVIRDEKGILAVPGLCISERAAAMPGDRVLCLRIDKEQTGEK